MNKQRLTEIEYLRAFAFLAVVLQHTIGHYAYIQGTSLADGVMLGFLLLAAKFAVPMFIFITGLVLFYNDKGKVPYGTFLRKRSKDILLPYLLWSILYSIIDNRSALTDWTFLRELGLDLVTGKASYHLWYIVMIFQFYLAYPFLRSGILWAHKKLQNRYALYMVLIATGVFYAWLTTQQSAFEAAAAALAIPVITPLFTEYIDRNALFFFFYFVLGAFTGLYVQHVLQAVYRWRAAIWTFFGIAVTVMGFRIINHFTWGPELTIHYNDTFLVNPPMALFLTLSLPAMLAAAVEFGRSAPMRWRRALSFIGAYSYTAYLAHALLLVAATELTDLLLPRAVPTLLTLVAFALCSGISVGAAVLLRKASLRLSKRAPGTAAKPKQITG
ncbi:acyltransferase [Paenibacillus silviterrae]|uniref:acyltransferase n=1 Tax=Paenibacillus silviterrae TaxID=3242194 RepID=UPI0025436CE7|nr:acyltransferase [Paenibacillus chinjuensis]